MKDSKQILKPNTGMTMVEVIVAFAIMLVLIAGFSKAITFTGRIMNKSSDESKQADALQQAYATDTLEGISTLFSGSIELKIKGQEGESFTLDTPIFEGTYEDGKLYYYGEHKLITD